MSDISISEMVEVFIPFVPFLMLGFSCACISWFAKFILNTVREDGFYTSASDVDESVDMPFNDFEPDEETEEIEEDMALKWTCDYCGSVHKNTECVCDSCGGRRLRW